VLALDWRGYLEVAYLDKNGVNTYAERAVALARELSDAGLLSTTLRHLASHEFSAYGLGLNPRSQAQAWLEEAVACAREASIVREVGYSLARLARLAEARGDVAEAERLSAEALVALRQAGDRDALKFGLGVSARLALLRGDRERARKELEEGAAIQRELVGHPLVSDAILLAALDIETGDFAPALARYREIIAVTPNPALVVFTMLGIARLVAAWGDSRAAARLLGATMLHRVYRRHSDVQDATRAREDAMALRAALGDEVFSAAWAEGESMSFDEAVAYALTLAPPSTTRGEVLVLTAREQEVGRLIAEGRQTARSPLRW
jgi:tetratricopeptide (TPR) repeat protein